MTEFWQWFLIVGGCIIFVSNVIYASTQLIKYTRNGKRNADLYFEKRVKKITEEIVNVETEKNIQARDRDFKIIRDFISSELKPINENIVIIKTLTEYLQHATITDLKIKLRSLYHDFFEKDGLLSKNDKSNWDKWFSDYVRLGGNSDVKTMNDHVQKVHLEITIETQKEKANKSKTKNNKKEGEVV